MAPSLQEDRRFNVAIVSRNPETLDGLEAYLRSAGVTTSSAQLIERSSQIAAAVSVLVVFPDDYEWDSVIPAMAACLRSNPRAQLVVVTSTPQRFERVVWPDDAAIPLIVPKPAWGWTILDVVRAHSSEQ